MCHSDPIVRQLDGDCCIELKRKLMNSISRYELFQLHVAHVAPCGIVQIVVACTHERGSGSIIVVVRLYEVLDEGRTWCIDLVCSLNIVLYCHSVVAQGDRVFKTVGRYHLEVRTVTQTRDRFIRHILLLQHDCKIDCLKIDSQWNRPIFLVESFESDCEKHIYFLLFGLRVIHCMLQGKLAALGIGVGHRHHNMV